MLKFIILGMVLKQDSTGYDIKKSIDQGIGTFYKASYGSLYPALKKMTETGLLTLYERPQGNRRKIFYHITEEGKSEFLDWLSTPTDIAEGFNMHLAKVFFYDYLPKDICEEKLLEYEMNCKRYLKMLTDMEKQLSKLGNKDVFYYKLSTLYYGIGITQKTIEWCELIRHRKSLSEWIERGIL